MAILSARQFAFAEPRSAWHRQVIRRALAAITALVFIGISNHSAHAQGTVTPTCPAGYVLSGSQCVAAAPAPTCPAGYVFTGGRCAADSAGWFFIVTRVLGVKSASELDGAAVCVVPGSPSQAAVTNFFRTSSMKFTPVPVGAGVAAANTYQSGACDVMVVESRLAASTLAGLTTPNLHKVLPRQIGGSTAAPPAPTQPCPYGTVRAGANCVASAPRPPVYPAAALYPREVQANLWGLGCLKGRVEVVVDGVWGAGSRAALRKFSNSRNSGLPRNFAEPTQAAFDATKSPSAPSCATTAAPAPPKVSGSCQSRFNACMKKAGRITHPRENFEMEQDCKKQFSACSGKRPTAVKKKARCSKIKFAFTRGNTCACSGGRVFTGSACVKPQQQQPKPQPQQSQAQCVKRCEAIGSQCHRKLTQLGDAKGWDGDLRQDYWDDNCAPKVNACKVACNPKGPMRPGECRYMADGEQVCS